MTPTVLADYPHRMGGHCGSGALRDLMHWHGLGWGAPPSEGLVFALGGSLDFAYVRSNALVPPIYLVGRGGDLELDLPRRLGATVTQRATDDPSEGWQWVRDEIDADRPVLVWADIAELPYLRVRLRMSRHDIVIIGYDDDRQIAHVVDNDRADVQLVPYDALARARSSTSFPEPTRHTIYDIDWPEAVADLRSAAADAFAKNVTTMTTSGGLDIGETGVQAAMTRLDSVQRFAEDVARWNDELSERELEIALAALAAFIEKAGTGGGLFRRLLAIGCAEIGDALTEPTVLALADVALRTADAWTALATAASSTEDVAERSTAAIKAVSAIPPLEHALVVRLDAAAQAVA